MACDVQSLFNGQEFLWPDTPPLYVPCTLHHHPPPLRHPPHSGISLSLSNGVSQSEVLGQFYNPNTTPKDKERVVVCLRGTGQELH